MRSAFGHVHPDGGGGIPIELVLQFPFAVAAIAYLVAAARARRGRGWPWWRSVSWVVGLAIASAGIAGPLATLAHGFVGHMVVHLLVGMVAPLLLVLGAPVTLALRTLAPVPARRVSALLRSPVPRVLSHPIVAALLNVGALWLLYRSPLHLLVAADPFLHFLVTAHFLTAGYLYTASILCVDPNPHRARLSVRGAVLVLSLAAHSVLAKTLYADPPPGVPADEAQTAAQLMFTGGDIVEVALMVLLGLEWYRASGRRLARAGEVRRMPQTVAGGRHA